MSPERYQHNSEDQEDPGALVLPVHPHSGSTVLDPQANANVPRSTDQATARSTTSPGPYRTTAWTGGVCDPTATGYRARRPLPSACRRPAASSSSARPVTATRPQRIGTDHNEGRASPNGHAGSQRHHPVQVAINGRATGVPFTWSWPVRSGQPRTAPRAAGPHQPAMPQLPRQPWGGWTLQMIQLLGGRGRTAQSTIG